MADPSRAAESATAWNAAFSLAQAIDSGGSPPVAPPTILLRRGESQFGSSYLDAFVYNSMDVEYSQTWVWGGGLLTSAIGLAASAAGNAAARNRAQNMARAQWRRLGPTAVVITTERLLMMVEGRWFTYHLGQLVHIHVDLATWAMVFQFADSAPIMLCGPWAPWLSVVVSYAVTGRPWPPGTALPARPAGA